MPREPDIEYIYNAQKEISILRGISALLDWDENTNMPGAALYGRSEQVKFIENLIQERMTSEGLSQAISRLKSGNISKTEQIIISELESQIDKARLITPGFRKLLVKHSVISQERWKQARKVNDLSLFSPYLKKMVELKRQQAIMLDPSAQPYDVLIREYEPGMSAQRYEDIFRYLGPGLAGILQKIRATRKYGEQKPLQLRIRKREQKEIITEFLKTMGISDEKVIVSTSPHPFTTRISRNDIRITTRFQEPLESFFAALHETGHALYEMNLPKRYYHTVIYNQASYGLDEAQAILWENNIGKSREFWQRYCQRYCRHLDSKPSWSDFYEHVNTVRPSLVRVNADEVTYILHIILRFEIERDLINGRLRVSQIRNEWNKKMQDLLGIVPKNDNEGLLQDIHWAAGDFGYFPTYALGMIYAAQLHRQMFRELPGAMEKVKGLDFLPFIDWLRRHVYSKGKTRTAEQIVKNTTGSGLRPKVLIDYLNAKYSDIYGF